MKKTLLLAWLAAVPCGCDASPERPHLRAATRDEGDPPERIVSLAPSITELLFELGAGERVVGVTRFCDRPPAAEELPEVADAKTVSIESILALEPDLIVFNSVGSRDALAPLRGSVPMLETPSSTLGELLDSVLAIGEAVGAADEARALRRRLDDMLASSRARARASGEPSPRVLVVVQREPFFVAGSASYLNDLLQAIGCENAAGELDAAWPCLSAEALIELAPDAIVDGAPDLTPDEDSNAEVLAYWSRFGSIPAVRDGRVRRLRDDAAVRPGPALGEALAALAAAVAPARSQELVR